VFRYILDYIRNFRRGSNDKVGYRMNWYAFPNFTEEEFTCSHTGECHMDKQHMRKLQNLRTDCGFTFIITSGYRHPTHPVEAAKHKQGEHCYGKATDIALSGERVIILLAKAHKHGFTRFGIKQSGNGRFVHLGTGLPSEGFKQTTWSY